MKHRDDHQYFTGRAASELEFANKCQDRSARVIHLKSAKCYRDLARCVAERDRIRASVAAPGRLH